MQGKYHTHIKYDRVKVERDYCGGVIILPEGGDIKTGFTYVSTNRRLQSG